MAACYYCNGSGRCDGCGGRGVQFDGRVCALCGGKGRCQRCTDGVLRGMARISSLRLSAALALAGAGMASSAAAQSVTPTVAYPGTLGGTPSLTQERGLNLPVPPVINVAAANAQEAAATLARRNAGFTPGVACGTTLPWVLNGTSVVAAPGVNLGVVYNPSEYCFGDSRANNFFLTAFAERRVESIVVSSLINNSIGNPGTVTVRGLGSGLPVLTVNSADLAIARRSLAQSARTQSHRRYFVGSEIRTGGGPTISSDRIFGQNLTGRDTLIFLVDQIGTNGIFSITGTQINCPGSTSTIGCQGGVVVDSPAQTSTTTIHTITTLYITTSVERTITGGTTFYDAPLTQLPIGAIHAAAQSAGFDTADRFLTRLERSDFGLDQGKRAHVWGEAWTGRTRFNAKSDSEPTTIDNHGFLLGAAFTLSDSVTLGVAGEWGRSDLGVASTPTPESAKADHLKGGVHARFTLGSFSANAAAMIGSLDVTSAGLSSLGTATGRYKATIKGASAEAGYDIALGGLTLRPQAGFVVLGWSRAAFAETGGPAPLSLARASAQQSRAWGGLSARGTIGAVSLGAYGRIAAVSGDRVAQVTSFDPQLPGVPFLVTGPDHGSTLGEYGAQASIAIAPGARFGLGYDGRTSGGFSDNGGRVLLSIGF